MIWRILQILFPLVLATAPWCLYRRTSRPMMRFYRRMLCSYYCRKLYTRMMVQCMLLFHFIQVSATHQAATLLASTIVCLAMFSHKRAEQFMDGIRRRRAMCVTGLVILVMLFLPHGYALAVTLDILLCFAVLYPSSHARDSLHRMDLPDDALVRLYYED